MPYQVKWANPITYTALTSVSELVSLANDGVISLGTGTIIPNRTNLYQYIQFWVKTKYLTGSASAALNLWFIQTLDGTNYEDGTTGTAPNKLPDVIIPVGASTSQYSIVWPQTPIIAPPNDFKVLLQNKTGYALSGSNSENMVYYAMFNDTVV
jgi:hypothetical protein